MTAKTEGGVVKLPVWLIVLMVGLVTSLSAWAVSVERRLTETQTDVKHLTRMVEDIHRTVVKP